jgi:hypothetical protein
MREFYYEFQAILFPNSCIFASKNPLILASVTKIYKCIEQQNTVHTILLTQFLMEKDA